jgi:hypothetical protein
VGPEDGYNYQLNDSLTYLGASAERTLRGPEGLESLRTFPSVDTEILHLTDSLRELPLAHIPEKI